MPLRPTEIDQPLDAFTVFMFRISLNNYEKVKESYGHLIETIGLAKLDNLNAFLDLVDTEPVSNLLCRISSHCTRLAERADKFLNALNKDQLAALEFLLSCKIKSTSEALNSVLLNCFLFYDYSTQSIIKFEK